MAKGENKKKQQHTRFLVSLSSKYTASTRFVPFEPVVRL